jgi:putative SOS response-associated peptidase YedK
MTAWRESVSKLATPTDEPITITPMRMAGIVRLDNAGRRETVDMCWGWVGLRAQNPGGKPEHIHARAETLDTKPTFRDAFLGGHRGIALAHTFNEGEEITPTKTRQHIVTPREPVGIAVLWERWTHDAAGEVLTFVMITTPANTLISAITDRMPAVLNESDWAKWLGEVPATVDELKAILQPVEGDWDMQPAGKPPPPPKPEKAQASLF